jgi:hypothetical protein
MSFMTFLANGSSNTYGSLKCYDGHITTINCTEENNDGSTGTIDADIPSEGASAAELFRKNSSWF